MGFRLPLVLLLCAATLCQGHVQEILTWNLLNYNFIPGSEHEKLFIPTNTVPTGVEVIGDKIFIATPRLYPGVPATLSVVSAMNVVGSSPVLEAFPDWSWHEAGRGNYSCDGLISVYRMRSDSCGRLWVLDSGIRDSLVTLTTVCPPKLVIFDTNSGNAIKSVTFPPEVLRNNSLFSNLIIDETDSSGFNYCNDLFIYITDTIATGIIVYDARTDNTWRLEHPSMMPEEAFFSLRIQEDTFQLMDGIVGFAFSPLTKTVYFQAFASDKTYTVSANALKSGPLPSNVELPVRLLGRKSSQGLGLAVNSYSDDLYYSPMTETALASWNPHRNQHEVLAYDPIKIQFAAEIRWFPQDSNAVWMLTSRFQKFSLQTVRNDEINIRILRVTKDQQPAQNLEYYSRPVQTVPNTYY